MALGRVLAVDLGGTFLKMGVFEGQELSWMQRTRVSAFQTMDHSTGRLSADLFAATINATTDVIYQQMGRIDAVMVTGQMAGLAFCNADGSAVMPLITWQESSQLDLETVRDELTISFEKTTGERLAAHLPLLKLREMRLPSSLAVTSLIGYVANVLCRGLGHSVHITDAASWGMCDVRDGTWVPELIEVAGVSTAQLPRISWNVEEVGYCDRLSAPVYCAVGDQQSALLGAALKTSEVSVNLATGCQVSMRSVTDETPYQIRPFFAGEFLKTRTHLPAGRLLESAVQQAYAGTGPAAWDEARRDVLVGKAPPRVDDAVREIASAISETYRVLTAGVAHRILFTGGLIQKFPAIQRQLEDELGVASRVFTDEDAALAGLSALAASI